jgi:hypothetical protein
MGSIQTSKSYTLLATHLGNGEGLMDKDKKCQLLNLTKFYENGARKSR